MASNDSSGKNEVFIAIRYTDSSKEKNDVEGHTEGDELNVGSDEPIKFVFS